MKITSESVYNKLNLLLHNKFLILICSRLRFILVLRIIRQLPRGKFRYYLETLLSPNHIRKVIDYKFKEKIKIVTDIHSKTILSVDCNNEAGYRYFLDQSSSKLYLTIAQKLKLDSSHIYLDIGAHIGTTCILVAKKFNVEVIAVEASPNNASLLLKNIARNKVKVTFHQFFATSQSLASKEKYIKLFTKNGNTGANSKFESWNKSITFQDFEIVRVTTLDTIISKEEISRIKMIKIDVEGSEAEVLAGFSAIENADTVILFEYRIDLLKRDTSENGMGLINTLQNFFNLYGVTLDKFGTLTLVQFDPNKSVSNAIGLPRKKLETYLEIFS
jgi:FkbM family methyltransferase